MKHAIYQECVSVVRCAAVVGMLVGTSACASAQIDFEEVDVTKQSLVFSGLPESVPMTELGEPSPESLEELGFVRMGEDYALPSQRFGFKDAADRLPAGVSASLRAKEVVVRAHQHDLKLSFLNGLKLTVSDPNVKKGQPGVVFEYHATERSKQATDNLIRGSVASSASSLDSADLGNQSYELTVWCDLLALPRQPWALDVTLTLTGSVELE